MSSQMVAVNTLTWMNIHPLMGEWKWLQCLTYVNISHEWGSRFMQQLHQLTVANVSCVSRASSIAH